MVGGALPAQVPSQSLSFVHCVDGPPTAQHAYVASMRRGKSPATTSVAGARCQGLSEVSKL